MRGTSPPAPGCRWLPRRLLERASPPGFFAPAARRVQGDLWALWEALRTLVLFVWQAKGQNLRRTP